MKGRRKQLRDIRYSICNLRDRHKSMEKDLISIMREMAYQQIMDHYESAMKKLEEEIKKLPIGHRYKGDFYMRKQYVTPDEYIKIENGSIFMREDLMSWKIEHGEPGETYYGHHRTLYKSISPKMELIKREYGDLVYEE